MTEWLSAQKESIKINGGRVAPEAKWALLYMAADKRGFFTFKKMHSLPTCFLTKEQHIVGFNLSSTTLLNKSVI